MPPALPLTNGLNTTDAMGVFCDLLGIFEKERKKLQTAYRKVMPSFKPNTLRYGRGEWRKSSEVRQLERIVDVCKDFAELLELQHRSLRREKKCILGTFSSVHPQLTAGGMVSKRDGLLDAKLKAIREKANMDIDLAKDFYRQLATVRQNTVGASKPTRTEEEKESLQWTVYEYRIESDVKIIKLLESEIESYEIWCAENVDTNNIADSIDDAASEIFSDDSSSTDGDSVMSDSSSHVSELSDGVKRSLDTQEYDDSFPAQPSSKRPRLSTSTGILTKLAPNPTFYSVRPTSR